MHAAHRVCYTLLDTRHLPSIYFSRDNFAVLKLFCGSRRSIEKAALKDNKTDVRIVWETFHQLTLVGNSMEKLTSGHNNRSHLLAQRVSRPFPFLLASVFPSRLIGTADWKTKASNSRRQANGHEMVCDKAARLAKHLAGKTGGIARCRFLRTGP